MAAEITTKIRVAIKLDIGNNKTASVSLGTLDKDNFDVDKAMNLVPLLSKVLDNSIRSVEKTLTAELESD